MMRPSSDLSPCYCSVEFVLLAAPWLLYFADSPMPNYAVGIQVHLTHRQSSQSSPHIITCRRGRGAREDGNGKGSVVICAR